MIHVSHENVTCVFVCILVHGGFTDWGEWQTCSVTCDVGTQVRERECSNPTPQHGGDTCMGASSESRECTEIPCPGKYCYLCRLQ